MLKQVEMEINGLLVSRATRNYPYRAYIEALLGFSKDAKQSFLSSAMYYPGETVRSSKFYPNDKKSKDGIKVNLEGKLHADLTFQGRSLIGNSNVKITSIQNKPIFYMQYSSDITVKVNIHNIYLTLVKLKVAPMIVDAHRKALAIASAKYPVSKVEVKQFVIPKGLLDVAVDNIVFGQIPQRMFICLVDNRAFNGSQEHDPFEFNHFNLNYICCTYDGMQIPSIAYTPNFRENKYAREFSAVFTSLGQDKTDSYLAINYETFAKNNAIFGFNFSPDLSNGAGSVEHLSPLVKGSLRLQLRFASALTDPITILAFCEFDGIIEIKNEGIVTTAINANA